MSWTWMNTTEWGQFFKGNIASQRSKWNSSLSKHSLNRTLIIEVNIYYLVLCLYEGDISGLNKDLDVISSSPSKLPGACMYPVSVKQIFIIITVVYVICMGVHSCVHAIACLEVGRKFSWIVSFLPALWDWTWVFRLHKSVFTYLTISLVPDFS